MHKYLTIMLLPAMIFGVSCGLVDGYIGNSETTENSKLMQESASFGGLSLVVINLSIEEFVYLFCLKVLVISDIFILLVS